MSTISLSDELLPLFIRIYYYYTYFTMLISWGIAPILFYVILTQSKTLKQLKWLISYYSFWSLFLTTYIGLFKPVYITPAVAGIQIGILRNFGSFTSSFIMTTFLAVLCCNCIAGLVATFTYRYLMVFPSGLKDWFTLKKTVAFIVFISVTAYILSGIIFVQVHQIPIGDAYQWAREYDSNLIKYLNEKTFFVAPYYAIEILFKVITFLLYWVYVGAVFIITFLLYQMSKYHAILKSTINYNLILSALIQGFVSLVFLLSPYIFIFTVFSFQIPYTSTISVLALAILLSHCFVDFFTTLFFITPYRRFLLKFVNFRHKQKTIIVPSTTMVIQK